MLRILLTNDDGVDAPGLESLFESVLLALQDPESGKKLAAEIVVVAPDRCRSECGHSIETNRPLKIREVRQDWHSLDGTPVDCVRAATCAMGFEPDMIFSGINAGANLGVNLMVSGTFAAAREANVLGYPSMAVSHYRRPDVPKTWDHAPYWLSETIQQFIADATPGQFKPGTPPLWNVNLPAVEPIHEQIPERVFCKVDRCPIDRSGTVSGTGEVRFELDFHNRSREPERDVAHCFGGQITISQLNAHWND